MKNKGKWITFTLTAILSMSMATGCSLFGSGGDAEPTQTPVETQAPVETVAPTATPVPTEIPMPTKEVIQPNDVVVTITETPSPSPTAAPTPEQNENQQTEPTQKPDQPTDDYDTGIGAGEGTQATVASAVNVRDAASTDSNVIGELDAGTQVTVLGASNGWIMIDYNGTTAYVYQDYLQ